MKVRRCGDPRESYFLNRGLASSGIQRSRNFPTDFSTLRATNLLLPSTMQGLDLTFETLGKSRNEAAIDVLIAALDDPDSGQRQRALKALISRSEPRAPELLLSQWSKLGEEGIDVLRSRKGWINAAIEKALRQDSLEAIEATESLVLTSVLPSLILLAESAASHTFRRRASDAVIKTVEPLGTEARCDRDQISVRGPVIARLADSLSRFSMHRNEELVAAFEGRCRPCTPTRCYRNSSRYDLVADAG